MNELDQIISERIEIPARHWSGGDMNVTNELIVFFREKHWPIVIEVTETGWRCTTLNGWQAEGETLGLAFCRAIVLATGPVRRITWVEAATC